MPPHTHERRRGPPTLLPLPPSPPRPSPPPPRKVFARENSAGVSGGKKIRKWIGRDPDDGDGDGDGDIKRIDDDDDDDKCHDRWRWRLRYKKESMMMMMLMMMMMMMMMMIMTIIYAMAGGRRRCENRPRIGSRGGFGNACRRRWRASD